jgi:catechol 2,3-dioxygenase-like lactoylglutathione lyase family enzyme
MIPRRREEKEYSRPNTHGSSAIERHGTTLPSQLTLSLKGLYTGVIMKIEHVNATVSNLERSFEFYNNVFGFYKRWEGTGIGEVGEVRVWHIGDEDIYLSLFEAEQPGEVVSNYGIPGVNHICFQVDDLNTYRAILKELNINIHLEADYKPGERIYFVDPDGIEIELVQY